MPKRRVFFSFEYHKDVWRASQVRNMGKVDNSSTFSDNDWEEVRFKTDTAIKGWIDDELASRSCLVVLIGATTSSRKWVKYEIGKAYQLHKGIVGIRVHNLKDEKGEQTTAGPNPFYSVLTTDGERLSKYVRVFDSSYKTSSYVFSDISENIEALIEEAIDKSGTY